jgi:hypothetical protein
MAAATELMSDVRDMDVYLNVTNNGGGALSNVVEPSCCQNFTIFDYVHVMFGFKEKGKEC